VRELLLECLDTDFTVRYATGPTLVSHVAANFPHLVSTLPVNYFYSVAPGESFRFFSDRTLELPSEAYLIHYAASNHKKLIPTIDATCSWLRSTNTVMAGLIADVENRYADEKSEELVLSIDEQPLISCLMVTANRAEIARVAIECFSDQTWPNKELVIIDDGAEDYGDLIASFDCADLVRYIKLQPANPRLSLGELRNLSIEEAHGTWCVQWDDDEWYHPERLAVQLNAAAQANVGASALKWTLMHVKEASDQSLTFRGDSGIATPGTLMFRKGDVRYPHLARNEDGIFLRDVKDNHGLVVLDEKYSHLFIRVFHGSNTWEKDHFLARLHRRAVDWPSWVWSHWIVSDVTKHRAFKLSNREKESLRRMTHSFDRGNELVPV
jgi:glycosyltransferase involved in cell wall biosynthesis